MSFADVSAQLDSSDYPGTPAEFARAVAEFSRHDAARYRHIELLGRLRSLQGETRDLRANMDRLREHTRCAHQELVALRAATAAYTRTLRDHETTPERTLILITGAFDGLMSGLAPVDRSQDTQLVRHELRQTVLDAYFAA